MTIQFHCPGCNYQFNAPDNMAGVQASCNQCQTIVTIPRPAGDSVPVSTVPASSPTDAFPQQPSQLGGQNAFPIMPQPAPASPSPAPQSITKPPTYPEMARGTGAGIPDGVWYLIGGGVAALLLAVVYLLVFRGDDRDEPVAEATTATPSASRPSAAGPTQIPFRTPASSAPAASHTPNRPTSNRPTSIDPAPSNGWDPSDDGLPEERLDPSSVTRPSPSPRPPSASTPAPARPSVNPSRSAPPSSTWSSTPPAAGPASASGAGSWANGEMKIPVRRQSDVAFGPIGCPVVVVKDQVWHFGQKRVVSTLESSNADDRGLARLSGDGQWFCRATKSPNQKETAIVIWHTTTGKVSCVIPGDPENYADLIEFSRNKYLLVGGRSIPVVRVYDITSGAELPSIEIPTRRVQDETTVFSPQGDYFTVLDDKQLAVLSTASKKQVAAMERPPARIGADEQLNSVQKMIRNDAVMRDIKLVRFSPDGQELAAVSNSRAPRLMCWNNRGKLVLDEEIPAVSHRFFFDPTLDWLPDKSGWIISGHVFERKSRRLVATLHTDFGDDPIFFTMDRERIWGILDHDPDTLKMVRLPWDKIERSLSEIESKSPALLAPHQPVGLKMQLTALRGDQTETSTMIQNTFVQRLERDGIEVGASTQTFFQLRFSEQAGDTLPIYEKQSPFDFRGKDTGRTATEATGALVIELVAGGKVLWRDTVKARSSSSFREEINNNTMRKSMLTDLQREMNTLDIPYYMPLSDDGVALPVVIN